MGMMRNFAVAALSMGDGPPSYPWPMKILYRAYLRDVLIECQHELDYICQRLHAELDKHIEDQDQFHIRRMLKWMDGVVAKKRRTAAILKKMS